jgi:hypothetical protein
LLVAFFSRLYKSERTFYASHLPSVNGSVLAIGKDREVVYPSA